MNPWALVVIGIGVLLIIMGVTGSYSAVKDALTGKPARTTSPTPSGGFLPGGKQPLLRPTTPVDL